MTSIETCSIRGGFFGFLLATDLVPLDFFQGVGRGWSFLSFSPQKTFFFFLWTVIRDIFFSCSWPGFFCFFLVPWLLVDIWLVNIYIYICTYIYITFGCRSKCTKKYFLIFILFLFIYLNSQFNPMFFLKQSFMIICL